MNGTGHNRAVAAALIAIFCTLLAFQTACAMPGMPAVAIEPRDADLVDVYPYEVVPYVISVVNSGDQNIIGLQVRVFVDPELSLVKDSRELRELTYTASLLEPGKPIRNEIFVKALQAGAQDFRVGVDYGFEKFTHSLTTFIKVRDNPVKINARLSKPSIEPGEPGSVVLDISNQGMAELREISAELLLPAELKSQTPRFELNILEPNQSFTNKEFRFTPLPAVEGKQTVVLKLQYTDEAGMHVFERSFVVEIQQRLQYLILILAIIVALVVASYALRRQKMPGSKPKGIEIKDIKPQTLRPAEPGGVQK